MKTPWYEKIMSLDKKVLYVIMFVVVMIPLLARWTYNPAVMPEVKDIYDEIEGIYTYNQSHPDTPQGILLSFDYSPSTNAELDPMTMSVLRHAFMRRIPVITWAAFPDSIDLAKNITTFIAKEYGAVYGKDFVFMGYPYPMTAAVIAFGSDVRNFLVKDFYGNLSTALPLLNKIYNYKSIGLIVTVSGTSYPRFWVTYANTLYGKKIATGTTAVSAAEFYPFLQTDQMIGMMGGLRGAAEYEKLVQALETQVIGEDIGSYLRNLYNDAPEGVWDTKIYTPGFSEEELQSHLSTRMSARTGMASQASAHFYVIFLIILANLGFFLTRRAENKR